MKIPTVRLRYSALCWIFATLISIHNYEESLSMFGWFLRNIEYIPNTIIGLLPENMSFNQMHSLINVSLLIATIIPLLVVFFSFLKNQKGFFFTLQMILFWVIAINSLQHIINFTLMLVGALASMSDKPFAMPYTPGLITGTFICLPFAIYMLYRSVRENKITKRAIYILSPISLISYIFIIAGIWAISLFFVLLLIQ